MCTVLLPPGDNPIAVNKYIISYHFGRWRYRPLWEKKVCMNTCLTLYTCLMLNGSRDTAVWMCKYTSSVNGNTEIEITWFEFYLNINIMIKWHLLHRSDKFITNIYIPVNTVLPRNRVRFNNQPDALIIPIYSVIKLYMFRAFSLSIIRSFLLYIRHW